MASLELLIRLARRATEEQQMQLAEISRVRAEADAAMVAHEDGIAAESRLAATDLDALAAFSAWGPVAARRTAALRQRSGELARSESHVQEMLRKAYVDMKRLEVAHEAAMQQAALGAQRRADVEADDREAIRRSTAAA